jgi:hypothetical protein
MNEKLNYNPRKNDDDEETGIMLFIVIVAIFIIPLAGSFWIKNLGTGKALRDWRW